MRLSEKYLKERVTLLNNILEPTDGKFVLGSSGVYGYSINFRYESTAEKSHLTGSRAGEVDAWLSGAIEMALSFKGVNLKLDKLIGQPIAGLSHDMTQEDVIKQWRENLEQHIGTGPAHLANALAHLQILKAYLPDDGDAMHITQQTMYSCVKAYRASYPKSTYDPLLAIKFGDSVLDNGDVTETS